jgi:hypothetical protein
MAKRNTPKGHGRRTIKVGTPKNNPAPKYKTTGRVVKQDREGPRKREDLQMHK